MNLKLMGVFLFRKMVAFLIQSLTGVRAMAFRPHSGTGFLFALEDPATSIPQLTTSIRSTAQVVKLCLIARWEVYRVHERHRDLTIEGIG